MANFNTLIKRKQYIWLGLILAGGAAAVGGGLKLLGNIELTKL